MSWGAWCGLVAGAGVEADVALVLVAGLVGHRMVVVPPSVRMGPVWLGVV
ncbi:hypothetical protein [Nocardia sp. NRRL S-836]|nr:hypothetical protein [Nocardia sp. NRRL S-836]